MWRSVSAYRGHVTHERNSLIEMLNEGLDAQFVQETYTTLGSRLKLYEEKWLEYSLALPSQDGNEEKRDSHDQFVKEIRDLRIQSAKYITNQRNQPNISRPTSPINPGFKLKLPDIRLADFHGDDLEWTKFWNQFNSMVHERSDIDEVTKYTYLNQVIKGPARQFLAGFKGQSSDYQDAVKSLMNHYGDERRVTDALITRLIHLESPRYNKREILRFKLELENTLMQLDHDVNIKKDGYALLVKGLIGEKLPLEVKDHLFQSHGTVYYNLDQIKAGLGTLLEYLGTQGNTTHQVDNQKKVTQVKPATVRPAGNKHVTKYSNPATSIGTYTATIGHRSCFLCKQNHYIHDCTQYKTLSARKDRLREMNRCQKCTQAHRTDECTTILGICPRCQRGKHHSFLCMSNITNKPKSYNNVGKVYKSSNFVDVTEKPKPESDDDSSNSSNSRGPDSATQVMTVTSDKGAYYNVALPTATVTVHSKTGRVEGIRALFDQGAQRSFILKDLADRLKLKPIANMNMTLNCFDKQRRQKNYEIVKLRIALGKRMKNLTVAVVKDMPKQIDTPGLLATASRLQQSGIRLADMNIHSDVVDNIQLLIGADFIGRFLYGTTTVNNVDLMQSPGGHLIYGIMSDHNDEATTSCSVNLLTQQVTESPLLIEPRTMCEAIATDCITIHKLWDLDVMGINPNQEAPNDAKASKHYEGTVKYEGGKYWVELPFKVNHPFLPHNYGLALGQMHHQMKRFKNQPELLRCYHNIIMEQLKTGVIEEVTDPVVSISTHYLPHHAVRKQSVTTPLRIVYNCSARSSRNNASLNDCLLTGPSLTEKLGDTLIKFRTNRFAFVADIEKAFLRIGLQSHHRDFTRFLWPANPLDDDSEIKTYRFASVLFGATCSPFLLQMTLKYHFKLSKSPFAEFLSSSFYVDNLMGTASTEKETVRIYKEANKELVNAGMSLTQWNSNSEMLKELIKHNDPTSPPTDLVTVLGLEWDIINDTLSLKECVYTSLSYITKRQLLSLVSTCFDPLGFCSPILIKGKLLNQEAWAERVGWDAHLPPSYLEKWNELAKEIKELPYFKFPRITCVSTDEVILHVFVDASTLAYGAVSYFTDKEQSVIVTSKVRVAPLKTKTTITLPQLELTALQLGTQLAYNLQNLFKENIKEVVIWSDSEAALQWIRNDKSNIPYVQNRVADIRRLGISFKYRHVSSKENPADLVTRGISIRQFRKAKIWTRGPEWLPFRDHWPTQKPSILVCEIISERNQELPKVIPLFDYTKYSSLNKMLRITNYIFGFIRKCKPNISLPTASVYWIQIVQKTHYPSIHNFLIGGSDTLDKNNSQFIKDLGLYIEESSGLIRSRGRLNYASIDYDTKFPILIPTKSHLAYLFITQAHERCLHGGLQETMLHVRMHYWMPKCRQTIKTILGRCVTCKRVEGRKFEYPGPPPLPIERVTFERPFLHVGIDYSGPLTLTKTEDGTPHKYYICLFTCTATRLVHLELASDMSTLTFLNLFRRFCAMYSFPRTVISDNGSNFVAGAKFFKEMLEHGDVSEYMAGNYITWKFIAPRAPWMGGFYERMIGLTKSCLKKVLYKKRLNREELETILREVQTRLNNRPLTYLNEDGPLEPLTPNHLLYGRTINPCPPLVMSDPSDPDYLGHTELVARHSCLSTVIHKFERIWKKDYLTSLREKHYGSSKPTQTKPPKLGEVVIVERLGPQHEWPLGRIVKLYPDEEDNIRIVDVLSNGVISRRTVNKLVPLEINSQDTTPSTSEEIIGENKLSIRPVRQAAQRAARLFKTLINNAQL